MLIEIVGVDGCGKTTLAHGIRRALNESGLAFAYERNFQSDGVRLLESAASQEKRARPATLYASDVIEYVRSTELVRKSFELVPYIGSRTQFALTDSYVVEQIGRLLEKGLWSPGFERLLRIALKPDMSFYVKASPHTALKRILNRLKGDAILLHADPLSSITNIIEGLEGAISTFAPARLLVLDGEGSIEDIRDQAVAHIHASLPAKAPV